MSTQTAQNVVEVTVYHGKHILNLNVKKPGSVVTPKRFQFGVEKAKLLLSKKSAVQQFFALDRQLWDEGPYVDGTELTYYQGSPILVLNPEEEAYGRFQFGQANAKLILEKWSHIEDFVKKYTE